MTSSSTSIPASAATPFPTLRVARPSDGLAALLRFYCDGLGLRVLARFENHEGFDGVVLGHEGAPYHLELTHARGHVAGRAPSRDHLLVLYLSDPAEWQAAVARLRGAGIEPVASANPYWDREGLTFEDPDGYRVVLARRSWEL